MRCLFCKQDSNSSRSVEHILPESLGNTAQTLPPGVVCDRCNNYFSRKVERPFLESAAIAMLRFEQRIPSKRGIVPPQSGILMPGFPAVVHRAPHGTEEESGIQGVISLDWDTIGHLFNSGGGKLIFPAAADPPTGSVASRFVGKVGLESMALRVVGHPDALEYLVNETQLDPLRDHVRRGEYSNWPIHVRRIYDANAKWIDENGAPVQLVHEADILQTNSNEWYFVLALFGLEFVINFGGPTVDGYQAWLRANGDASPLYTGKNASSPLRPAGQS